MYNSHTRWLENRQQVISLKSLGLSRRHNSPLSPAVVSRGVLLTEPQREMHAVESVRCMWTQTKVKISIYSERNSLCHGFCKEWFYVLGQSHDCEPEVSSDFSAAEAPQGKGLSETTLPPTGQQ